jgi:hypothetical protein
VIESKAFHRDNTIRSPQFGFANIGTEPRFLFVTHSGIGLTITTRPACQASTQNHQILQRLRSHADGLSF